MYVSYVWNFVLPIKLIFILIFLLNSKISPVDPFHLVSKSSTLNIIKLFFSNNKNYWDSMFTFMSMKWNVLSLIIMLCVCVFVWNLTAFFGSLNIFLCSTNTTKVISKKKKISTSTISRSPFNRKLVNVRPKWCHWIFNFTLLSHTWGCTLCSHATYTFAKL